MPNTPLSADFGLYVPSDKNINIGNTLTINTTSFTYTSNGTGAVSRTFTSKLADQFNLNDFGVAGNGSVNDANTIQNALNEVSTYGGGSVRANDIYYINSVLTIPSFVTIQGSRSNFSVDKVNYNYLDNKPVFILGPSGSITMGQGSKISGLTIVQANCATLPTSNAVAQAVINGFSGTAITIAGDECTVEDSLIIGFNKAIAMDGTSYSPYGLQRLRVDNVGIDCTNGIDIQQSYDTNRISRVHLWNYYNGNNPSVTDITTTYRLGKGIYIHNHCDGTIVTDCLDFGHQYAYYIDGAGDNVFALQLTNCLVDGGFGNSTVTSVGLYTNGYIAGAFFDNISSESHTYNFWFNHSGQNSTVTVGNLKSGTSGGSPTLAHYRFGANSSGYISTACAMGGAANTGSICQWDSGVSKWNLGLHVENTGTTANVHTFASNSDMKNVSVHSRLLRTTANIYDPLGGVKFSDTGVDVEVSMSANASFSANTTTIVPFDTIIKDSANNFDTSTHTFTAPTWGRYVVELSMYFAATTFGQQPGISIYVNGVDNRVWQSWLTQETYNLITAHKTLDLSYGDNISIVFITDPSGGANVYYGSTTTKLKIYPISR